MIKNVIKKLLDDTQYITAIEKQNSLLQQKNVLLQQNLEKVKADKVEDEDAKYKKRSRNYLRPIDEMTSWLLSHYEFRYNVITDVFEYRKTAEEGDYDEVYRTDEKGSFAVIDKYAINSIAIEVQEAGIFVRDHFVERLIKSKYAKPYHPIRFYINKVNGTWDGKERISDFLRRINQSDYCQKMGRIWLRAMVAQMKSEGSFASHSYSTIDKHPAHFLLRHLRELALAITIEDLAGMMLADSMQALESGNRDETVLLAIVGNIDQFLTSLPGRHLHLPVHTSETMAMLGKELLVECLRHPHLQASKLHLVGRNQVAHVIRLAILIAIIVSMSAHRQLRSDNKHIADFHFHSHRQGIEHLVLYGIDGSHKLGWSHLVMTSHPRLHILEIIDVLGYELRMNQILASLVFHRRSVLDITYWSFRSWHSYLFLKVKFKSNH